MSKEFPEGVLWYTTGTVTFKVHFPENHIYCSECDFCYKEHGFDRYRCRLTNERIYAPDVTIGNKCPVVLD